MKILKNIIVVILSLSPVLATATDTVLLDPARTSCRVQPGGESRTLKCDIFFENFIVHEGRSIETAYANGDCVKCREVLAEATLAGKKVRMLRDSSGQYSWGWDSDIFFTVDSSLQECEGTRQR